MRRATAGAALVTGIVLIVITFALSLFPRAYAGERIADKFRPVMSPQGLVQQQEGLALVGGFLADYAKASKAFAPELGMNARTYDRFVAANYPAVATANEQVPQAAATVFEPVVAQLHAVAGKFQAVTNIPGLGLPIAGAPWLLVILGSALAVTGTLGLITNRKAPTVATLALSIAMLGGTLALSLPAKTSDANPVLKIGRVALSPAAAKAAHSTQLAVDAAITQFRDNMIPDLAGRLHVSRAALEARISRDFPGIATALREWPAVAPAAYGLIASQAASINDFKKVDGIGYSGLAWLTLGPGIVLLLLAGAGVGLKRRHTPRQAVGDPQPVPQPATAT